MWCFSSLKSGIPYRSRPPIRSLRSYSVTACPARASCWAAAMPAGPEPTTATVRPVGVRAGNGVRRPSSTTRLMISTSTCLMVTGLSEMPEHAGGLARRRAQPAGELREVVGRVQRLARVLPPLRVDQVVPRRDQVAQRAALVAERDAAVHAAGCLLVDELVLGPVGTPHASPSGAPAPAGTAESAGRTSKSRSDRARGAPGGSTLPRFSPRPALACWRSLDALLDAGSGLRRPVRTCYAGVDNSSPRDAKAVHTSDARHSQTAGAGVAYSDRRCDGSSETTGLRGRMNLPPTAGT